MSAISDGKIIVETELDTSGIQKGTSNVKSSLAQLANEYRSAGMNASEAISNAWIDIARESETQSQKTKSSWTSAFSEISSTAGTFKNVVGKALSGIGKVVGGIGKAAIDAGMDFDTAMHEVKAIMGDCADECKDTGKTFEELYSDMTEAAKKYGSETKYTATEAAEALGTLKLSGMSCADAIGTLPAVLNLATAGNLELDEAAEIVSSSMHKLGVNTEDTEHYVDQLAKTSQSSGTNVNQLGRAIGAVGGTAKNLHGGIDELCTVLGILANNGIYAENAGIRVRNMIMSLSSPTDEAAGKMKELGLSVFDAEGNLRPLPDIFNDLDSALSGMTQEEKLNCLDTLFNKTDLAAANALLDTSADKFNKLSEQIKNCDGATQEMADTMKESLEGKMTTMESTLEGLKIALYEKLEEPLKKCVDTATEFFKKINEKLTEEGTKEKLDQLSESLGNLVDKISNFATEHFDDFLNALDWIINNAGTVVGWIEALVAAFVAFTVIEAAANLVIVFGAAITFLSSPIGLIILAIGALVGAVVYFMHSTTELREKISNAWKDITNVISNSASGVKKVFQGDFKGAIEDFKKAFTSMPGELNKNITQVDGSFAEVATSSSKYTNNFGRNVGKMIESCGGLGGKISESLKIASDAFGGYHKGVVISIGHGTSEAVDSAKSKLSELNEGVQSGVQGAEDAFDGWQQRVDQAFNVGTQQGMEALQGHFLGLKTQVENGVIPAQSSLDEFRNYVQQRFGDDVPQFVQDMLAKLDEIPGSVGTSMEASKAPIQEWSQILNTDLKGKSEEEIQSLINNFANIPGGVANGLDPAKGSVSDFVGNIGTNLNGAVPNEITGMLNSFGTVPGGVETPLTQASGKADNFAGDMEKSGTKAGSHYVSNIVAGLNAIHQSINSIFAQAMTIMEIFAGNMGSAATNAGNQFSESLVSALNSVIGQMSGIGGSIVEGVLSGIYSMAGSFYSSVSSFFSGIVEKAKSALKVGSPSKLMRDEVGRWILPGVAEGIESTENAFNRSLDDTFENAVRRFHEKMKASVSMEQFKSMPTSISSGVSGNVSNTTNIVNGGLSGNLTIKVPVNLDGQTIAEAQAPYSDNVNGTRLSLTRRGLIL